MTAHGLGPAQWTKPADLGGPQDQDWLGLSYSLDSVCPEDRAMGFWSQVVALS